MPLCKNIEYIHEPTDLQCGQAVIAMLAGVSVDEVISVVDTDRETKLRDMFSALDYFGISYNSERKCAYDVSDLPAICILSLETPRCWHWSLWHKGTVYDPEHGILSDFPESNRKFYFEIYDKTVGE